MTNTPFSHQSSLQLNVGIIAACAPTLKPLVGRALKLSSYATNSKYGNYADMSRSGAPKNLTGGGRSRGMSRSRHAGDAEAQANFEMHSRPFGTRDEPTYRTSIKGGAQARTAAAVVKSAVYPASRLSDGSRSGSEEYILQGTGKDGKGIVRTTEITVQK